MKLAVQGFVLFLLLVESCYSAFSSKISSKSKAEVKFSPKTEFSNNNLITLKIVGFNDRPSLRYASACLGTFEKKNDPTLETIIPNKFLSLSDKIDTEIPRFSEFLSAHAGKQYLVEEEVLTRSMTVYFKFIEETVSLTEFQHDREVIISTAMIFSILKNDSTTYLKILKLF